MKVQHILGIVSAVALILFAVFYPVPEKQIDVGSPYSDYENKWSEEKGAAYVGGDAYNLQIEASLKAGYMSGVLAMKSVTFVGGVLLLFLTIYSGMWSVEMERKTQQWISEWSKALQKESQRPVNAVGLQRQVTDNGPLPQSESTQSEPKESV